MSYYGPEFGGIDRGWYRISNEDNYAPGRDVIDKRWDVGCDAILINYVKKYGTFFSLYHDRIMREIDKRLGTSFKKEVRYYEYYLANRAFEIEETRRLWVESHNMALKKSYECPYCSKSHRLTETHPDILRSLGVPPSRCRTCNYVVSRYGEFWDEEIAKKVRGLMSRISRKRECEFCQKVYSLEKHIFSYESYGSKYVDCLYPNLFVSICPKCFGSVFRDYKRGAPRTRLARLYDLFKFTGEIPTQDFDRFVYLYRDHDSLMELLNIFRKLRTPHGYAAEFGGFFSALVQSGILPEGSRRMTIGTMVLARDGHLCLSLVEKEIDDYLFANRVPHDKEVGYPGSKMRTDWEIFGTSKRIFVEYFGLMGNPDYAAKAAIKIELAEASGIELIDIYPGDDWKEYFLPFIKEG